MVLVAGSQQPAWCWGICLGRRGCPCLGLSELCQLWVLSSYEQRGPSSCGVSPLPSRGGLGGFAHRVLSEPGVSSCYITCGELASHHMGMPGQTDR